MKLFYAPGACSIGIHILLEEIGKPYEPVAISLREGDQLKPEFIAMNPKSKVPTLVRDDGSVLTEFPAIAFWLARTNPQAKLLADDAETQARALEAMEFATATMHMQGFSRVFRPARFGPSEEDAEAITARGKEIIEAGFKQFDTALAGKEYLLGTFSVADAALFFVEFWGAARLGLALPANVAAHFARMKARPAVARAMAREGLAT